MNRFLATQVMAILLLATANAQPADKIPAKATKLGLTTFVEKVEEAGMGLLGFLNSIGPLTVFAPINDAFKQLPPDVSSRLDDRVFLNNLLRYHVHAGRVPSSALADERVIVMGNLRTARVNLYPKGQTNFQVATLQCAQIDLNNFDNMASNGIIHVINSVMMPPSGNILAYLQANGFSTLVSAVTRTGLGFNLIGFQPLTLFAPTDAAFAALPADDLNALFDDVDALRATLLYHLVDGTFCKAGLTSGSVQTRNGTNVQITVSASVTVNNAKVTKADCSVTNGVVHVVDSVILP